MTDAATGPEDPAARLARLVELWYAACTDFVALAREIPREQWDLPTDLEGWSVKDNVAHTAHLEAVLAGSPEETIEVAEAPHLKGLMNYYTEQGVLARRDRDMAALADEIEEAVATRYAALRAEPPTDPAAAPPRTPGGVPWNNQTLLNNRPLDVWMHEQDIRRAIGRARRPRRRDRGTTCCARSGAGCRWSWASAWPHRPGRPCGWRCRTAGLGWTVRIGDDGRAAAVGDDVEPTTTVALSPEDYVVLAGGRRTPDATEPRVVGDEQLAHRVLESLAVTP